MGEVIFLVIWMVFKYFRLGLMGSDYLIFLNIIYLSLKVWELLDSVWFSILCLLIRWGKCCSGLKIFVLISILKRLYYFEFSIGISIDRVC